MFCRRGTWSPFYYQVDQYIGPGLAWSYCGLISWPLLNITDSFGLIETNPEHLDRFCLPTKTVFFFNGRKIKKKPPKKPLSSNCLIFKTVFRIKSTANFKWIQHVVLPIQRQILNRLWLFPHWQFLLFNVFFFWNYTEDLTTSISISKNKVVNHMASAEIYQFNVLTYHHLL